jgi:hypothetical protein
VKRSFAVEFYFKLHVAYNTYNDIPNIHIYIWYVILFNFKNILNVATITIYFKYVTFGNYNGFFRKARVSAWMYFLVNVYVILSQSQTGGEYLILDGCLHPGKGNHYRSL